MNNLEGVLPVPYRLPELRALAPDSLLFIGEGEKVVECLVARGLNATTNHGGAGKWHPRAQPALPRSPGRGAAG